MSIPYLYLVCDELSLCLSEYFIAGNKIRLWVKMLRKKISRTTYTKTKLKYEKLFFIFQKTSTGIVTVR